MIKKRQVRLKDIGSELGLSVMAVSKALRDQPDIGLKTRNLVKETAKRMGYIPNYWAKDIRRRGDEKVVRNIAYIYQGNKEGFFTSDFLAGIRDAFSGKDNFVSWSMISKDAKDLTVDDLPVALRERMADGVIVGFDVNPEIKEFLDAIDIPIVYLYCDVHEEHDCVWHDECHASALATEHLLAAGYDKIFMFTRHIPDENAASFIHRERLRGCREVLSENGLELKLLINEKATIEFVNDNCGHAASLTGVFSYLTALEHGIKVPKDLGVVDIDMSLMFAYYFQKIDRVPINRFEMGTMATEMLLAKIATGKPQITHIERPDLIVNGSVKRKISHG